MTYYDLIVLLIIAVSVLFGIYKGFVSSAGSIVVTVLAWGAALLLTDDLALFIQEKTNFLEQVIHYVQVNETITDLTLRKTSIYLLTPAEIDAAIEGAKLPVFFKDLIASNIENQVFPAIDSLGEYFDYTVGSAIINVASFVVIVVGALLAGSILKAALEAIVKVPALKYVDGLLGAGFGVIRGVFIVYVFFMILPTLLLVIPEAIVTEYLGDVSQSPIASVFYNDNLLLKYIGGIIKL
ncbi:MAG: CvpA family protein [Clostridia bacterium]|nr:CvpA family protein [Clostridia bacterium]